MLNVLNKLRQNDVLEYEAKLHDYIISESYIQRYVWYVKYIIVEYLSLMSTWWGFYY
jgi:hypothetical protein